jgi:hypothetical protein
MCYLQCLKALGQVPQLLLSGVSEQARKGKPRTAATHYNLLVASSRELNVLLHLLPRLLYCVQTCKEGVPGQV